MKEFIENTRKTIFKEYQTSPSRLIADYFNETRTRDDYQGRQLLEMLQNAEDAAKNAGLQKTKVLLQLKDSILTIANNGEHFTEDGVDSLFYANNSAKIDRKLFIGQKGLGFRSLLNWSNKIRIISGDLRVEYSRENALVEYSKIATNDAVKRAVNKKSPNTIPVAILVAPKWIDHINEEKYSEYDTYVEVDYSGREDLKDISKDIHKMFDAFNGEELLFLECIHEISIITDSINKRIVKEPGKSKNWRILKKWKNGKLEKPLSWHITKKQGSMQSRELDPQGKPADKEVYFQIAVAIPSKLSNTFPLYSFFSTKEETGLPLILHGTFDLKGNRENLMRNKPNNLELISRLVDHLTETALKKRRINDPWYSLRLLNCQKEDKNTLYECGFHEKLLQKIQTESLFPCIDKDFRAISNCIFIKQDLHAHVGDYKRFKILPNLITNKQGELINDLIINRIEKELSNNNKSAVRKSLSKITSKLSMRELGSLIIFCNNNSEIFKVDYWQPEMPTLLINQRRKKISNNQNIFIGKLETDPPDSVKIDFLNRKLAKELISQLNLDSVLKLPGILREFRHLKEIDEEILVSKVFDAINIEAEKSAEIINTQYKQLLHWCFINRGLFNELYLDLQIKLPRKRKGFLNAKELYFGEGYESGERNEDLFCGVEEDIFISQANKIGLGGEPKNEVFKFLKKLGVKDKPQRIKIRKTKYEIDGDFVSFFIEQTNFPTQYKLTNDRRFIDSPNLLLINRKRKLNATSVEYLDKILSHAPMYRILEWLNENKGLLDNDKDLKMEFWIDGGYREISNDRPVSYFGWKISISPWLALNNGNNKKYAPQDCMFDEVKNRSWKPWVNLVDLQKLKLLLETYNERKTWKINELKQLLIVSGVRETIPDFMQLQMVKMLQNVPQANTSRKNIEKLYRQIGEAFSGSDKTFIGDLWRSFREDGSILLKGDKNEIMFNECRNSHYIGDQEYPNEVYKLFSIAAVHKNVTNHICQDLFGLSPLPGKNIMQLSKSRVPVKHPLEDEFDRELNICKPFIYAYRISKTEQKGEDKKRNDFKNLKISLCTSVTLSVKIGEDHKLISLSNYEFYRNPKRTEFFLVIKNSDIQLEKLLQVDAFLRSLNSILSELWSTSGGESDYIRIFEVNNNERRENLVINAVGRDALSDSIQLLGGERSPFFYFWYAIFKVKGEDIVELGDENIKARIAERFQRAITLLDIIDYNKLQDIDNLEHIGYLFKAINITVSDFNEYAEERISAKDFNRREIRRLHERIEQLYKKYIFNNFKNKSTKHKKQFIAKINLQSALRGCEMKSFSKEFIDYEDYYFKLLQSETGETLSLLELLKYDKVKVPEYKPQIEHFKQKIKKYDSYYFNSFVSAIENESRLYFSDQIDDLAMEYEKFCIGEEKAAVLSNNASESVKPEIKVTLTSTNFKRNRRRSKSKTTKARGPRKSSQESHEKNVENGLIGESAVFIKLKELYNTVTWVSEYAKLEGINTNGTDGLGFDITYEDNNGITKYVEVKSSTSRITSFFITSNEYKKAKELKDDYQLAFVRIYNKNDIRISFIRNIFMNEDLFSLEPKSYTVDIDEMAEQLEIKIDSSN